MQRTAFITISLVLVISSSANAKPGCVVFSSQATGINGKLVSLQVGKGHGLNANFIPTRETIEKVWIDDQSKIGISFDGNLCQWTSSQQAQCNNSGATVIHLRQTKLINFPDLPRSHNGSTLLSAITQGESGRKLYQFSVTPVSGVPPCSSITIVPDPPRLEPLVPATYNRPHQVLPPANNVRWQPQTTPPFQIPRKPQASLSPTNSSVSTQAISDASAASRGLAVAKRNKRITFNATLSQKTHKAINLLGQGMSQQEAASRANIPVAVLSQLIFWGQQ